MDSSQQSTGRKRGREDTETSHFRDPASVPTGPREQRVPSGPARGSKNGRGSRGRGRKQQSYNQQRKAQSQQSQSRPSNGSTAPEDLEEGEIDDEEYTELSTEQASASADQDSSTQNQSIEEPEMEIDFDALAEPRAEPSLEEKLAEKRKRRAALLAQFSTTSASASPAPQSRDTTPTVNTGLASPAKRLRLDSPAVATSKDAERNGTESPEVTAVDDEMVFDLGLRNDNEIHEVKREGGEDISAADYDPDEDRKLDDARQLAHHKDAPTMPPGQPGATAVAAIEQGQSIVIAEDDEADSGEEEEEGLDDEDDMFAVDVKPKKKRKAKKSAMVVIDRSGAAQTDDGDDADGYYRVILGEVLDNGRYHVHANLGRGMFSSVVRAKDMDKGGKEVAIKMIRSQETMYKAGQKEAAILRKLHDADPHDKKHIVRMDRTFDHRAHLCLVFESLSMNLREVVRKFGKDVGINLRAVRAYAHQMFLGLNLMRKTNIMHADIKPDNLLVNENHSQLKISDLGSASDTSENDITPYLVSRFYRAPEIILGLLYDCSLDTWSIGCTLYELYTGKILFPGRNNNQMLYYIQELKGKLNNRLIKKGKFTELHFDDSGNFLSVELNKATGTESTKKLTLQSKGTSDLRSRLATPAQIKKLPAEEAKLLTNFVDLLDRTLELDPAKRILPKDALNHAFFR